MKEKNLIPYIHVGTATLYYHLKMFMSINLANIYSHFLFLYPLSDKKYKVYLKLDSKTKFNFLMKHLLSESRKNKLNHLLEIYDRVQYSTTFWKKYAVKNNEELKKRSGDFSISELTNMLKDEVKYESKAEILTLITMELCEANYQKRRFMLKSNDFIKHCYNKVADRYKNKRL